MKVIVLPLGERPSVPAAAGVRKKQLGVTEAGAIASLKLTLTGAVRLTVPEVLRIELRGTPPRGVTAKDIVLHLLALPSLRAGAGVGKVFEFGGEGIAALNTDERTTLTNMTAELALLA